MKPMLAGKYPGDEALAGHFPLFVQPKLDGIRCCIVDGVAVTRTLKEVPNREIQAVLGCAPNGLDGELIVGWPTSKSCYRDTCSFVMSEDKTSSGAPWTFYAFDLWNTALPFSERRHQLNTLILHGSPHIRGLPCWQVPDLAMLKVAESDLVAEGYEGVILRSPDALYKFGRGTARAGDLLKLKRFTDSEATVIGVYEEMHNANEATTNALGRTERSSHARGKVGKGTLGGLEVRLLRDHAGFPAGTEFRIGTGFDAQMRRELWAERETLIGRIAKFKHFEVGAKDKPRHPVFLGWRDLLDIDPSTKRRDAEG
jgi:DNA ligase-1